MTTMVTRFMVCGTLMVTTNTLIHIPGQWQRMLLLAMVIIRTTTIKTGTVHTNQRLPETTGGTSIHKRAHRLRVAMRHSTAKHTTMTIPGAKYTVHS